MVENDLKTIDGDCKHTTSTFVLIAGIVFLFVGTAVLRLGNDFLGYCLLSYILSAVLVVIAVVVYMRENKK